MEANLEDFIVKRTNISRDFLRDFFNLGNNTYGDIYINIYYILLPPRREQNTNSSDHYNKNLIVLIMKSNTQQNIYYYINLEK